MDGKIFSETHLYIAEAYSGAKEAVERIVNMSDERPYSIKKKR